MAHSVYISNNPRRCISGCMDSSYLQVGRMCTPGFSLTPSSPWIWPRVLPPVSYAWASSETGLSAWLRCRVFLSLNLNSTLNRSSSSANLSIPFSESDAEGCRDASSDAVSKECGDGQLLQLATLAKIKKLISAQQGRCNKSGDVFSDDFCLVFTPPMSWIPFFQRKEVTVVLGPQ